MKNWSAFRVCCLVQRKEGKKEGRKEGRKEGKKEGRKEGRLHVFVVRVESVVDCQWSESFVLPVATMSYGMFSWAIPF